MKLYKDRLANSHKCKNYCGLYIDCERMECNRKAIFTAQGKTKMVQPSVWGRVREKEKMDLYQEDRTIVENF